MKCDCATLKFFLFNSKTVSVTDQEQEHCVNFEFIDCQLMF